MSEQRYLSAHDVSMRWNNGLAKYKGKWYHAQARPEETKLTLLDLVSKNQVMIVDPNDDGFHVTTPDLGFLNSKHGVMFLSRAPVRRQKQAAATENLLFEIPGGSSGGLSSNLMWGRDFVDMLNNVYPAYQTAIGSLSEKNPSLAFSRDFAVTLKKTAGSRVYHNLWFKGNNLVSEKDSDVQVWVLEGKYNNSLMIQSLAQLGVPISA